MFGKDYSDFHAWFLLNNLFELRFLLCRLSLKFWLFQSIFYLLHHLASACVVPMCHIIPQSGTSWGSSAHIGLQLHPALKSFSDWCVSETLRSWLTLELALLVVTSLNTSSIPFLLSLFSFSALLRLTLLHVHFFYKQQIIPALWCKICITQ